MNSSNNYEDEKMVKAELIENPQENELIINDNVPDVDVAIEQWDAYQKLCKGLLNDTDYQEIIVKEKDENGNYVKVKRHFKKKSAWQKLSRAFNVDTEIVDRDLERTKMGRVREAYYCVRASLPNGRSVESDALCSRSEKGKDKVSDHTIMSTAKTRATNRAISELIGAGEVSSDEMTAEFKASDDSDHHYISAKQVHETPANTVPKDTFETAATIGEPKPENDPVRNTCMEIKRMLEEEGKLVTKFSMKLRVVQLIEDELLPPENKAPLCEFINKYCPEELE